MKRLIPFLCLFLLIATARAEDVNTPPPEEKPAAQTAADPDPLETAEPAPEESSPEEVISTEMPSADSLDIVPREVVVSQDGGTHRDQLESTVFRREEPIVYSTAGRRDPFRALIVDEKKEGEVVTDLLRLDGAQLTGVVWADGQYLAMLKDKEARNFFLREGDEIYQGRVTMVTQSQATFEISEFGEYDQITLKVRRLP